MENVVGIDGLAAHLRDSDIAIADCRFALGRPEAGREAYRSGHIPGAVYWDLEQELSGPIGAHGGRHPLPDPEAFSRLLGQKGIDQTSIVVAYDDQGGAFAARFWWMLRFLGHRRAYVLDRGFSAWQEAGFAVSTEVSVPKERTFTPQIRSEMLVSMEDVRRRLHRRDSLILDSREASRYAGLEEPIDPVAGHIPGARNAFWKDGLRQDGSWKEREEQLQRFSGVGRDREWIVYCGSGVTACPNVLALTEAGFTDVKLYAGSWSDWISYADNPVATGEE